MKTRFAEYASRVQFFRRPIARMIRAWRAAAAAGATFAKAMDSLGVGWDEEEAG